ncbi:MAG: NAD(P)H-dependent oxidoreductase subunit E [Pirellulaceae bacterium]|nr:NAD(P)H-dependent oxidoreductase subunit E [Pirellulaceae bacterium]
MTGSIQLDLLRDLMRLQRQRGFLDEATLREVAERSRVPLYRLEELVSFYPFFRRTPPPQHRLQVCRDVTCAMSGGGELLAELQQRCGAVDADGVEIEAVSCLGRCDAAPAVACNDTPLANSTAAEIAAAAAGDSFTPLAAREPEQWRCDPYASPAERYGTVLQPAADLAQLCLERLRESDLRGMGGAGFPTARKWELVRDETALPKYVICNADESEPGTFKDRVILNDLPHLVIEGMVLAALTIGAEQGVIYLRHEYELEQQSLEAALDDARSRGVLGANAANSGRPFDIEIFVSPGGYILGEETALLEALEDKRGEPRNKPPYPGSQGLWGKPTLINNVETFALAAAIIARGSDWWRDQGAGEFAGVKFVSVSGDVCKPGVFEIPLGTPVADVIEMAGGLPAGNQLQAFLPGGASSNFLPADKADTPLDFDSLRDAGSMLGTGALIVIGDQHDLFDLATNIVTFFRNESCGKCVPCRLGGAAAVDLLQRVGQRVGQGDADADELDRLPELADTLEQTSICGLGQVALNPIISLMNNLPHKLPR